MHRITMIETNDGSRFSTEKKAIKYLDEKYGECLTRIVHKILQQEKYTQLLEFLDNNLDSFQALIDLKREMREDIEEDET